MPNDATIAQPEAHEAARRAALDAAVRCLSQREHGRRELQRKLLAKGHASALVDDVLEYLADHDLQSDARFVESYCYSRTRKGYGPLKIRQELSSRGVGETELEQALTMSADFWLGQARAALDKRFGGRPGAGEDADVDAQNALKEDRDAWNARARFLARRGFPSDLIFRVLGACHG